MARPEPKQNAAPPATGPEVNQSGKPREREADQGIRRDHRGQDQPKDRNRAQGWVCPLYAALPSAW
jgi:hypothetical protein